MADISTYVRNSRGNRASQVTTEQVREVAARPARHCGNNAVAGSFFGSLKKERIRKRIYKTREIARAGVFDYIEVFYNRTRCHRDLGGSSSEAFERAAA